MATVDNPLEQAILTRLLHAHPAGLGKEILDNYRGEEQVAACVESLQQRGWVQASKTPLHYPIKLSAAGVDAAKSLQ
ncbi:hypothetical protein [Pseudomonas typographi]|uniref:ArsR family transcriptional regulator n=1 Tax=Pseudomonas typographi TaxID=2715964 RepID=A0ABR7Z0G1_9PSED|nr:hypothetical protein [Pseudomonas typographi]MBD1551295.1 hypothetical protein [Pseudomonas typographi]MBD1588824.1 hypothetical protein [Pseudomonas typographi]MBD1598940.1 hypothetical protein [Pseudomonas typographi]